MAQLVERILGKDEVPGSNPGSSSNAKDTLGCPFLVLFGEEADMELFANAIGILAVVLFVFSYQLRTRRNLIICNAASRVLYVLQYILLGAFEGALLDIIALAVTIVYKRCSSLSGRSVTLVALASNIAIVVLGMTTYKNYFSLLPIVGVIFETVALLPRSEKKIRLLSLLGAPFWLIYNLISSAYGSAVGNVITIVMIVVAIVRLDIPRRQKDIDETASSS